jgi:DNA-directed RNA polymerase specialized sigma24 family protein
MSTGQSKLSDARTFRATRWSLIARAGEACGPSARQALSDLYHIYCYPLYAYARRRGFSADAASDLIQSFFVELIDGSLFRTADPSKGRFRSYLLGALKHFMCAERDRAGAQKRGGGETPLSVDDAELRYRLEPTHDLTPERLFERQWALASLAAVMGQLEQEYARDGKQKQFEQLKTLIAGPLPDRTYADVACALGTTEGAVKVAVHRFRRRYRDLLTSHIAETVQTLDDVDEEIRHLHAALARPA